MHDRTGKLRLVVVEGLREVTFGLTRQFGVPSHALAQVHAALAYYHANREEIEGYLAEEEADDERLRRVVGALG